MQIVYFCERTCRSPKVQGHDAWLIETTLTSTWWNLFRTRGSLDLCMIQQNYIFCTTARHTALQLQNNKSNSTDVYIFGYLPTVCPVIRKQRVWLFFQGIQAQAFRSPDETRQTSCLHVIWLISDEWLKRITNNVSLLLSRVSHLHKGENKVGFDGLDFYACWILCCCSLFLIKIFHISPPWMNFHSSGLKIISVDTWYYFEVLQVVLPVVLLGPMRGRNQLPCVYTCMHSADPNRSHR